MKEKIDWKALWEIHSPFFADGFAKVPLPSGESFLLKPGAGFGDASHPTTILILDLLVGQVKDKTVVDVGAGSGILSIASRKLGAKKVHALEIDPSAIEHLHENIDLNQMTDSISVNKPLEIFDLVLINMISSEQKTAFSMYPELLKYRGKLIVSGLLCSEKESYLSWIGGKALREKVSGDWLAMEVVTN